MKAGLVPMGTTALRGNFAGRFNGTHTWKACWSEREGEIYGSAFSLIATRGYAVSQNWETRRGGDGGHGKRR